MTKGGGKGRISNELVAASCAAVLAVYAAGYWRTRGEVRRMDARASERSAARNAPTPVPAPSPATNAATVIEAPAASPAPQSSAPSFAASPPAAPKSAMTVPAAPSLTAEAQPVAHPATPPPGSTETVTPAPALVAAEPASQPLSDSSPAPSGHWRDGTYTGWGTSRHGDIKAQVVIHDGRIVDAGIASCETRYPCDVIGNIIPQPVARQSPDVDHVSRATESADAYYYALVEALKEAQSAPDGDAAAPQ